MTRVLIVPQAVLSARALALLPATSRALRQLSRAFDVQIFPRGMAKEAPEATEQWPEEVDRLREVLHPGTHVVTVGDIHHWLSLLAVSGWEGPGSLVIAGSPTYTPATLRGWGLESIARMLEGLAAIRRRVGPRTAHKDSQGLAFDFLPNGPEALRLKLAMVLEEDLALRAVSDWADVNLLERRPDVRVPTLFLERAPWEYTSLTRRGFLTMVPHAEIEALSEGWPDRMELERSGEEFAQKVTAFIDRVEAAAPSS